MSINGEDTEMADCDGEKVVTMMDVLQEQQEIEDDANAVLGASDDKDCTFSKGYIKRQAIYACLTCCSEVKEDPSKRAGVCLACSLNCHENHDLIELYTKRNFSCDCGNSKFNSHPCQFTSNKTDINEENKYNQNFSGLYCTCHRPYPDPESTDEEEMIQCVICEDWLHASHLEATVPAHDQYSEMICKLCMENNEFLHDYSEFAVNILENEDVDVTNGSIITDFTLPNGDSESKTNDNNESPIDEPQTKDESDVDMLVNKKIENEDRESMRETVVTEEPINETSNFSEETEQTASVNTENKNEEKKADNEVGQNDNNVESNSANDNNSVMDVETSESKDKEESSTEPEKENGVEKSGTDAESVDAAIAEVEKKVDDYKPNAEEANSVEVENDLQKEANAEEKQQNDVPENGSTESTNIDTVPPVNDNSSENKESSEVSVESEDNKEIEAIDKLLEEDIPKDNLQKSDAETKTDNTVDMETNVESTEQSDEIKEKISESQNESSIERKELGCSVNTVVENMETNGESTEQSDENVEKISETQSETIKDKETEQSTAVKQDESTLEIEKNDEEEATCIKPDVTEKIADIEINAENTSKTETADVATIGTEAASNGTQETKRKLSTEEDEQAIVTTKKAKLDEDSRSCVRPKVVKRIFKGATFWGSNFRQKLCTCGECISMYKDLSVLFLIDPEDTVTAYEALGKERTDGAPATQYEKGLQALSSLDRIQQINALTEYNKMRDKLLDFLKSFKDRKEVVKEEDIKAFFAGMKPTRESDGVYFCR